MSTSNLINDIVAVLFPLGAGPGPNASDDDRDDWDEHRDQVMQKRAEYASNLEAAADALDKDLLTLAIGNTAGRVASAETDLRRLVAYGREAITGRPYSHRVLGAAAGKSETWARSAYSDKDVAAVRAALDQPALLADPEFSAMQRLAEVLAAADETQRAEYLADPDNHLRGMADRLDDDTWHRVVAWLRDRYTTTAPTG